MRGKVNPMAIIGGFILVVFLVVLASVLWPAPPLQPQTAEIPQSKPAPVIKQVEVAEPAAALPAVVVPPNPEPKPPATPARVLPHLNASDGIVKTWLGELSTPAPWLEWLAPRELIRKWVLQVDNIRQGKYVRKYAPVMPPLAPFKPTVEGDVVRLGALSYKRYNNAVNALLMIDQAKLATLYREMYPLFQQAQGELGQKTSVTFHSSLLLVIDHILAAPVLDEAPLLHRPGVLFQFKDPSLEALPASHKLFLRMGPDNTRKIKIYLRRLKISLETT